MFAYFSRKASINRRLAPNLRRLKMNWINEINLESIEILFEDDVLFSLTQFILLADLTDLDVLHNVLSKLSSQCLYRFDVTSNVTNDEVSLSDPSNFVSNTFEKLKVPVSVELESSSKGNHYYIRAMTLPRVDSFFSVYRFVALIHR